MIVLVVSPLCLGDGPIVTTNEVLAVPAELGASKITIMDIYILILKQHAYMGPIKTNLMDPDLRDQNFSTLSQSDMH